MTSAARAPRPVRRPAAADAPAPPRLDNLTVSRKEGFRAFAEAPTRHQPENLTVAQLAALSDRARRDYNHRRSIWHANLPLIKTTQVAELLEQLTDIVESNQQDGDKPKGAIAIEGPAGVGKSSAILAFAKDFHLDTIADLGERTGEGHERWPVCRVGLNGNTGIKDFNKAMLGFYNHAGIKRGTAVDFANRALDCVLSCETRLLIVDDIHFLKQRTTSVEISNQFKYISNEFPLTIVFIGIDLRQRGFYSDGGCFEGILGQSGRRITPLKLRDFSLDEAHRHEWRQLLLAIEQRIMLARKHRGMLVGLSDVLFERSTGRIGSLTTLVSRACQRAVRTGAEYIDRELLAQIPGDAAAEQQRAEARVVVAASRKAARPKRDAATRAS
jgi:hypothetical protein